MTASRTDQEVLLAAVLDEAPRPLEGRTYLQKVTFLVEQTAGTTYFGFEPYDYGPFSRDLYDVLDYFLEWDYATESEIETGGGTIRYHYTAGPAIGDVFGHGDHLKLRGAAKSVYENYPTNDLTELIDRIYTEYPQMAQNSVI
jgi:hypothetical protein